MSRMPLPRGACEVAAHQSTIVKTVSSGALGLVGQKRVWHAGLAESVLCKSLDVSHAGIDNKLEWGSGVRTSTLLPALVYQSGKHRPHTGDRLC